MNNTPLISITIPVYNTEKYLEEAFDSLVNQTYKNLELIVVNNGSTGNVEEIYSKYSKMYTEFKWKLINLKKNVGLYHARITGFDESTGEYFTTMDSDDTVSVDFYYQLVNKAIETGADIVSANYVNDFQPGSMMHYPMNLFENNDICWEGKDILANYLKLHGECFNFHALWCKLYSIDLWKQISDSAKEVTDPIVLSEDILFSTMLYSKARKLVNIQRAYYYHRVTPTASSFNIASSNEKILNGMRNQKTAFSAIDKYLKKIGRYDELREYSEQYYKCFCSIMFENIRVQDMSAVHNSWLNRKSCEITGFEKPVELKLSNFLAERRSSPFNNSLEEQLKLIMSDKIKVVSFDVFDTLVERPFYRPNDTFMFLSYKFNEMRPGQFFLDFANYRAVAESSARDKIMKANPFYKEVNLNEIYDELQQLLSLTDEEKETLKAEELKLEYRFCHCREIGKYLYDFAIRNNKKVVCVSDMYMSEEVIKNILEQNGYTQISDLFVSSEYRCCKYDGSLFKKALKKLKVKGNEVVHIGDNFVSDYQAPEKSKMEHIYTSSAREMLMGRNGLSYTGESFLHIWGDENSPTGPLSFLGTRCLIGVAERKAFGNPFMTFEEKSDFDSRPLVIGYYILGMYVFTIAKWLVDSLADKGYRCVHFIARDGYLIKQAYDILAANSKRKCPKSNYLYTSRKSTMPLMVASRQDLYALSNLVDYRAYTPEKLLEQMKDTIEPDAYSKRLDILEANKIPPNAQIESIVQWNQLIAVYEKFFYSEEAISEYRKKAAEYLGKEIQKCDCTFDIGYSVRSETVFSELLGYTIDAFYLYCYQERARIQAYYKGIGLNVFHKSVLEFKQIRITETILSGTHGSCSKYYFSGNEIKYDFVKTDLTDTEARMIDSIQNHALDFVRDFVTEFPDEWEFMQYSFTDKPMKYYISEASLFDKGPFSTIVSQDELSSINGNMLTDEWSTSSFHDVDPSESNQKTNHKDGFFYLMKYDRKTLKERSKKKLAPHPFLYRCAKKIYSVGRKIYHCFRKKA